MSYMTSLLKKMAMEAAAEDDSAADTAQGAEGDTAATEPTSEPAAAPTQEPTAAAEPTTTEPVTTEPTNTDPASDSAAVAEVAAAEDSGVGVSEVVPDDGLTDGEVEDVADESEEMDSAVEDVDRVVEAGVSLEALADHLAASANFGGIHADSVGILNHALNANRVLAHIPQRGALAAEAWGGAVNRRRQTSITVEEIKVDVKAALKSAGEFLRKLYEKLVEYLKKIFVSAERMKAAFEKAKAVPKHDGPAKTDTVTGGWIKSLVVGTEVPADVAKAVKEVVAVGDKFETWAASAVDVTKSAFDKVAAAKAEDVDGILAELKMPVIDDVKEDGLALPGNAAILPKPTEAGLYSFKTGQVEKAPESVKTLTYEQIQALCDAGLELYGTVSKLKETGKNVEKAIKAGEGASGKVESMNSLKPVKDRMTSIMAIIPSLGKYMVTFGNAVGGYITASQKAYAK